MLPSPRLALPTFQGLRGLGVHMHQHKCIVVGIAAVTCDSAFLILNCCLSVIAAEVGHREMLAIGDMMMEMRS